MYIIKGFLIIAVMLFCCIEVGKLWNRSGNYLEAALIGFATMLAVFNLFCIPMHIFGVSFTVLCICFSVFLIGAIVTSLILTFRRRRSYTLLKYKPGINVFLILAICMIILQIWRLFVYQPQIYGDDETYLTMVNDIVTSDRIQGRYIESGIETEPFSLKYMATSYYPFLAYWCRIFHFHPLLLCKTFLPILTTLFAYGVFLLLGEFFFKEDIRKKGMYLLLVTLLVEFGNISYHFFPRKLLQWPWQSKSVLYTILMPLLFYLCISLMNESMKKKETMLIGTVLFANAAASLMGVGFSTIMLFLIGAVRSVHFRRVGIFGRTILACIPTGIVLFGAVLTT